jgi:hypothetical protein
LSLTLLGCIGNDARIIFSFNARGFRSLLASLFRFTLTLSGGLVALRKADDGRAETHLLEALLRGLLPGGRSLP